MFTKEEFGLAKKLYLPLKVIEICEKHGIEVEFKELGKEHVFYMKKKSLIAGMVISSWCKEDKVVLYAVEKMISRLDWEIRRRNDE